MKRIMRMISIFFLMMLLVGCTPGGSRTALLDVDDSEQKANERLDRVIQAINNQDKNALKAEFAVQILKDSKEIDTDIDELFKFIPEKIVSYKKSGGPTVYRHNRYGQAEVQIFSYYYVKTEKKEYYFLIDDQPRNDDSQELKGMHLLVVVRSENRKDIYDKTKKMIFDGDKRIDRIGVYLPIKDK